MSARFRNLLALASAVALGCHPMSDYRALTPGPRGVVVTPVRDYPFGDAVDVYRAALDLLYVDGEERPSIIVMHDSLRLLSGNLCRQCPSLWPGKSTMDTSTLNTFWTLPRVQPRIRNFGYNVPIHFLSYRESAEMWTAGQVYDSTHPRLPTEMPEGPDGEFRRRYPGAWGTSSFSLVGFNRAHTEALLEVRQICGTGCYSDELVFFRNVRGRWRPIERLTRDINAVWTHTRLRYRGPSGKNAGESQMLVDQLGIPLRPESKDAPGIYRAVLDSLYSFYGERPRTIVISGQHALTVDGLLPYKHQIDSSTRAAFRFLSAIPDWMHPSFSYRLPIAVLTNDSMQALHREGIPLEREANLHFANEETTPFWLAFRKHYPNAWGYVELSRIGYNPEHTQALVYASHHCGKGCLSGDVWFLTRKGEDWSVAEKLPRYGEAGWALDSLRYIGRGADPKNYRPRRAQGIVSSFETGAVLPFLDITFTGGPFLRTVRTDSTGRYALENLPFNSEVFFRVKCPISGRSDTVAGPYLMSHPGMDTTVNIDVQYRGCTHLNRADPLIAGATQTSTALDSSRLSPEVAGVYRGILDALYPLGVPERSPIMLEGFTSRRCVYCIEHEMPRLIRKGLIDPSTEANFAKVPPDTRAPPPFSYRRKIEVMPMWDLYWLGGSAARQWDAMRDAYPGVNAVISFAAVGFNDRSTEALVELHADSTGGADASETMLLKKTGSDWRVALRHVEREATSGEWRGSKCEAGDAPAQLPTRSELEKLGGVFSLIRTVRALSVGASREFRDQTDTVRVRLEPLKASPTRPNEFAARASVFDATGEPQDKIAAKFQLASGAATITFTERLPEGVMQLDGWLEELKILRVDDRGFAGSWFTANGPSVPWRGYFCAPPVSARSP